MQTNVIADKPFWYRCQRCGLYYGHPQHTVPSVDGNRDMPCASLGVGIGETPVFPAERSGKTPNV